MRGKETRSSRIGQPGFRAAALVRAEAACYLPIMPKPAGTKPAPAFDPFDPIGSEQRMLDAFLKAADSFDAKHGRSKAAARKQLHKEGIITKAGNLTRRYGG
jgi:hypothetical protein